MTVLRFRSGYLRIRWWALLKLDPWEGFLDFNPSEVGHMLDDKDNDDNGND